MTKPIHIVIVALILFSVSCSTGLASRIKDLADIEGVRYNQLVGYGPGCGSQWHR